MRESKLPLRTVLQNFINHVDSLEASREAKDEKYEQEFQELKKLTESLKNDPEFCCIEGEKECNRRKNRYKDILPYDKTRVVLQSFPGVPGSDYINANYIRGASGSRAYIASQGPLPNTVPDFWRLVVECDVQVIVMASNETEGGKHKCECYWVENDGEEKQFGNVVVTFVQSRQVCPDFLVRTMKITYTTEKNKSEERTICQFHYMLWPDHGVPDTVRPLLDMVRLVRDCQASETLPVLVHCSAGCGRTGTICAIDYVWGLLRTGKLIDNLYLLGLVREMRFQRVAMVQTKDQYTLLHQAVKELFRERLSLIDSHPYENIATDGNPLVLKALKDKERDYEELFVSQEKQDQSAKTSTPTPSNTPTTASTPSGSLPRKPAEQEVHQKAVPLTAADKDNLRRSVSTSSLDTHHVPVVPGKRLKILAPFTSHFSDVPDGKRVAQSMLSLGSEGPEGTSPTPLVTERSVIANRRPPTGYSKMEKEAENLAQKMEAKERDKKRQSSSIGSSSSQLSTTSSVAYSADMAGETPGSTPTATPNSTPNPLWGIGLLLPQSPPVPPPRSKTPSPVISIRKAIENQKKALQHISSQLHSQGYLLPSPQYQQEEPQLGPKPKKKNTEIVRRPSIQKLKELFERPSSQTIICPNGSKLSRSVSSVASRPSLSLLNDNTMSLKVKRKGSLGSEDSVVQSDKLRRDQLPKLQICPPPPPDNLPDHSNIPQSSHHSLITSGKPPSSPVTNSPGMRRRFNLYSDRDFSDEKHSILLSRLEDRPALPVKKSKSFRWSRPHGISSSVRPSDRSPEFLRKREDLNTYFSLDRAKNENGTEAVKPEINLKKLGDGFPPPHEGLKLSVYAFSQNKTPPNSFLSSSEESLGMKNDTKPLIPPKRYIADRCRNPSLFHFPVPGVTLEASNNEGAYPYTEANKVPPSLSATPNSAVSLENPVFWDTCTETFTEEGTVHHDKSKICEKVLQDIDCREVDMGKKLSTSQTGSQTDKDYVNARVLKANIDDDGSPRYVYVPLPSKRATKDKDVHSYANCNISGKPLEQDIGDIFTSAEYVTHRTCGPRDTNLPQNKTYGETKMGANKSAKSKCATAQTSSSVQTYSPDYEPVDFGEASTSVDEVFETVNYELLDRNEKQKKKDKEKSPIREYYLNRELDSIAIQVYQDCQEYLLHGTNKSPVPSLMIPKNNDKDDCFPIDAKGIRTEHATEVRVQPADDEMTDLEVVRNKVAVPPQGLRSRERRNSYRQAISPTSPSYTKVLDGQFGHPRKTIHKYEKIWFDSLKENEVTEELAPQHDRTMGCAVNTSAQDFSSNLNQPMNISGKETLFRDKLEELHGLVASGSDRKRLPDLSEEDLSSRDSGSTSSLISRSAQSSRSSERTEPIYVNTPLIVRSPSPSSRTSKSETSLLAEIHSNPLVSSASPYGTLATTTSYPYKPKMNPPLFKKVTDNSSYRLTQTATLPARSTLSPPSPPAIAKNIPPPKGFRNAAATPTTQTPEEIQPKHNSNINTSSASTRYGSTQFSGQYSHSEHVSKHKKKTREAYYVQQSLNDPVVKSHSSRTKYNNGSGVHGSDFSDSSEQSERSQPTVKPIRQEVGATTVEKTFTYNQENASTQCPTNPSLNPSVYYHRPSPPKSNHVSTGPAECLPEGSSSHLKSVDLSAVISRKKKPEFPYDHKHKSGKNHLNRRSADLDQVSMYPAEYGRRNEKMNRRSMDQDQIILLSHEKQLNVQHEQKCNEHENLPVMLPANSVMSNSGCSTSNPSPPKDDPLSETSSTDTSGEEEGIFHKITAHSFLRKLRSGQNKNLEVGKQPSSSSKSTFFLQKEGRSLKEPVSNTEEHREKSRFPISPPGSPRPLVKAFGKLKISSKSVAANFKSYLNMKGNSNESGNIANHHNPLQKSASSGPSIAVFSQVVEECGFQKAALPNKPKEMLENVRCYTNNPSKVVERPRQQYL